MAESRCGRNEPVFLKEIVKDQLFVDCKDGIPMLRLATDLMFIGHFAPFMTRKHTRR